MIYKKETFQSILSSLTDTQKLIFDKVFITWLDDKIEINDIEFAKLPLTYQNKIISFLTTRNFVLQ